MITGWISYTGGPRWCHYGDGHVLLLLLPGITVLLSLTVFMLLVAEIMPATSDSVPLIGRLYSSMSTSVPHATDVHIQFYSFSNLWHLIMTTTEFVADDCNGYNDPLAVKRNRFMMGYKNRRDWTQIGLNRQTTQRISSQSQLVLVGKHKIPCRCVTGLRFQQPEGIHTSLMLLMGVCGE